MYEESVQCILLLEYLRKNEYNIRYKIVDIGGITMNTSLNGLVKNMLEGLYAVGGHVAELYRSDADSMRQMVEMDFVKFILYLGHSDGKITKSETEFINEFFGYDMTAQQWYTLIEQQGFNITTSEVPATFEFFIKTDNYEYSQDNSVSSVCEMYIQTFKALGENFLGVDGNVDSEEVNTLNEYLDKMQKFYEEKTMRTNISKVGSVDAELAEKLASVTTDTEDEEQNKKVTPYNSKCFSVRFFDKEYDVPEDALTFLQCREFVSNGLIKLLDESTKLMNKYSRMGGEKAFESLASDTTHLQQVMLSIVQDVHKDLLSREIYDVDEVDLFAQTPSIKQVETRATEVSLEMLSAAMEVQSENQAMRDYAYRSAASNITGSGVRIFTSSFTSLMVHSAIENSILKSQAKKADQEYEQALKRISASSGDKFTRIATDGIFNKFLPSLPAIFTTFHDELFKCYLVELAQHNQFDIDSLEEFSENKSSTMLENIKHAGDKKKLLIQAFEMCPFNIEVYEKMLELGYFDIDTMKDAKKIFKGSELDTLLEEKIKSNLKNIDSVKDYITVLAYYKGKDERTVLLPFYQSTISRIKNDYHELLLLCADSRRLDRWISENINSDMDKVVATSEDTVKDKVNSWIKRNIEDKQFSELSDMGLITIEDIRMKDSTQTTLEEVKAEYVAKLISLIADYIKEAGKRKIAYEEAYDKFDAEIKKRNDAISEKYEELKQQGMFAFSKKKEIKAEIEQLQNELENFRKTEPVDLKNAYFGMYSK